MNKQTFLLFIFFCGAILRGEAWAQTAQPYDIIINEIMPDPTPSVGLPNAEYIELFNRSTQDIDLQGFKIVNGSVSTELGRFILRSGRYVTIYTRRSSIDFGIYGDTLPVARLGTLSNPNDTFYLFSRDSTIIDATAYDLSFYQNSRKAEGGWSLERVFTNHPCRPFADNWLASNDLRGGTPSQPNSVQRDDIDRTPPTLLYAFLTGDRTIQLRFDKSLFRNINLSQFEIAESLPNAPKINIRTLRILPPFFTTIELNLTQNLQLQKKYQIIISDNIMDCLGNPMGKKDSLFVQLPEKVLPNDLIINEILFDAEVGGSRYVELFNRSNKAVNLATLRIADLSSGDLHAIRTPFLLMPKNYVVLAENTLYIQKKYNCLDCPKKLFKNNLPTWDANSGNVTLLTFEGNRAVVIDSFDYNKNFHNPFLADIEGVALERIGIDAPTQTPDNWHSAAAAVNYGTPTRPNSVARAATLPPSVSSRFEHNFRFEQTTFSPDDDGFEDVLLLHYQLDTDGWLATIRIFDAAGRLIKNFTQNEILANRGFWKWSGDTDEGERAAVGIYIWHIELQHTSAGMVREREIIRKNCVLATKF